MDLASGTSFAGHRIEGIVGRGGMGVVYRATHLALDRIVALKVIREDFAEDEEFRARFRREAQLAGSIDHPNVLPVMDAGEENGVLYITMRFVAGSDLGALIRAKQGLDPVEAVRIVASIADALDAAHAQGLIHRDVKPANVLLEGSEGTGRAYLTDFGLTRRAASGPALTRTGQWVGTLSYVAPEQIEGRSVDARVDIYSLACVLYEALAGAPPFSRDSDVATMYAHLNEPPPALEEKLPGIPPALSAGVQKGMAKNPDDRFGSAAEFGRVVKAGLAGNTVASEQEATRAAGPGAAATTARVGDRARPHTGSWPRSSLRPLWIAAGLVAVALVVAGALVLGGGGDEPSGPTGDTPASAAVEPLDSVMLDTRPSGTPTRLSAVEDGDGGVAIVLEVDEGSGFTEIARTVAPGAIASQDSVLEAGQQGKSYEPEGGQGLLAIGDDYDRYFGWNIDREVVEFF